MATCLQGRARRLCTTEPFCTTERPASQRNGPMMTKARFSDVARMRTKRRPASRPIVRREIWSARTREGISAASRRTSAAKTRKTGTRTRNRAVSLSVLRSAFASPELAPLRCLATSIRGRRGPSWRHFSLPDNSASEIRREPWPTLTVVSVVDLTIIPAGNNLFPKFFQN